MRTKRSAGAREVGGGRWRPVKAVIAASSPDAHGEPTIEVTIKPAETPQVTKRTGNAGKKAIYFCGWHQRAKEGAS